MKKTEFVAWLHEQDPAGKWWVTAAKQQIARGERYFKLIGQRGDPSLLYLARIWLSEPILRQMRGENGAIINKQSPSYSTMLHFFMSADDDGALHDHPGDYETTILSGGYVENLPPQLGDLPKDSGIWPYQLAQPGPATNEHKVKRCAGDPTVVRKARELHCISAVLPGTWTLFHFGPKYREWGFWPEGKPWVHHGTYLDAKNRGEGVR